MSRGVSVAEIISADPTFERQMRVWQTERARRGEDPFNWQAFRELEASLAMPDPGDSPPREFFWFTPPAGSHHEVWTVSEPLGSKKAARPPAEWAV